MDDLRWNLTCLRVGLQAVLPVDHPLLEKAEIADELEEDPLPVWREVAALPWEVVEDLIWAVGKEHALWNLESGETE